MPTPHPNIDVRVTGAAGTTATHSSYGRLDRGYGTSKTLGAQLTQLVSQFNSVYLDSPFSQITNVSQSALQSVHIDIPDL